MAWSTACPDWQERILAGRPLVPDLPLLEDEAARALRVFKRLRLPDVIGNPTMGEAAGAWFLPVVAALFGSYDPAINRRLVQEFFLLVPKKNGKSSYAAALMVTAMIVNRRPAAEFLLIAPTKEIADIAFKQASGIIRLDAELNKLFHPQRHIRTITHRQSGAVLQIKAADTDVITGSKSTGILVDETHVFAKKARAADVFIEIRGALAARPDGFMIQISTQSKEPPAGVFKAELEIARDVRDGKLRLPLLPILYELPRRLTDDNGWKDEKFWPLVNPNMGRSVDLAFLQNELLKAERTGPEAMALLASQHFNVEIGLALSSDRWAGADYWTARADSTLDLDELLYRSDVVVVGIDGGGLDDLLGLAVLGRDAVSGEWLLWTRTWAHETALERRKSIAPMLRDFERAGDLVVVRQIGEDVEQVVDLLERIAETGLLPAKAGIGVDVIGIAQLPEELAARGFTGGETGQVVAVTQGWKLSGAIKTAERALAGPAGQAGTMIHAGQALMAWNVGNAKIEPKGNAVTITKQAAGSAKIDTLMATFNAVSLMYQAPQASGRSVYEALAGQDKAQAPAEEEQPLDWAALQDVGHPLFAEMKRRFEERQAQEREDWL